MVSDLPRLKSAYDFLGLLYCFMMCLCCPLALCDIFHTAMTRYSLFVLKMPLNTKQTHKQYVFFLTTNIATDEIIKLPFET